MAAPRKSPELSFLNKVLLKSGSTPTLKPTFRKNFHFHLGEAICLHNVQSHKSEFDGKVHVILGRNSVNGELWAIVSDEKTTLQTFAEYGLRFDIEENFLDDQSCRLECSTFHDS